MDAELYVGSPPPRVTSTGGVYALLPHSVTGEGMYADDLIECIADRVVEKLAALAANEKTA